ncbi:MAG TPA: SURF1 family protein [Rhizomicrobium sp.]|nr:SURF1 family protein [Rhizomicrobium sp.]
MTFRPYPGLTIACVLLVAILCGLGVWQLERLQWKLALIATVTGHMTAPPLTLDHILAMKPDDAQYRRVMLSGRFDHAKETYVFTTDASGAAVYHVLTPFHSDDGKTLIVDRGEVPKERLDPVTRRQGNPSDELAITGVWRAPDAPGLFTPPPDVAHRIWYARDLKAITAADHLTLSAPVVIEADATPIPGGWPKGGQTVFSFRNQHLSYAVTWFGLAVVLLCIWFSYNISKGRIAWK